MSRQPIVVPSDSEDDTPVKEVVAFTSWKDEPAYNAVQKACQPCYAVGRKVLFPNRIKAIYHWAVNGFGKKDPTATIKDCLCSCKVPELVAWARQEVSLKHMQQEKKAATERQ